MQERNVQLSLSDRSLSQVCHPLSNGSLAKQDARKDEASGRNSLIGSSLVQVHYAIGTGLLLFPYTFWAFGGVAGGTLIQLVSKYILLCETCHFTN